MGAVLRSFVAVLRALFVRPALDCHTGLHDSMKADPDHAGMTSIGVQDFDGDRMALYNCKRCGSTLGIELAREAA